MAELPLSSAQRKFLRGRAHALTPRVQVGKAGVTDPLLLAIDAELTRHELIKVKIVGEKSAKAEACAAITERLACAHAGTVGHVAILYRPHPEPEKRKIELPE